ncbi:hypothetical protein Dda_8357 [Drechslerella dactyloides]|uniref:Uncharacterized protein n=1 Tax=Drechslerella dactyloides TaxID=74499 RepID=A0AAD6NFM0_DREDA|nr:hypothetical protein Dda_8357 [Drechslerella dactyloides]
MAVAYDKLHVHVYEAEVGQEALDDESGLDSCILTNCLIPCDYNRRIFAPRMVRFISTIVVFGLISLLGLLTLQAGNSATALSTIYVRSSPKNMDREVYNIVGLEGSDLQSIGQPGYMTPQQQRPLVLYAYHETPNARRNALFFIKHGLHGAADFIFILNGATNITDALPSAAEAPNIRVIQRNNTCFDMGAYGEVLSANDEELVKRYHHFILLNASIRGPFMPTWSRECWSDAYLSKLTDKTKLVGMSYNCKANRTMAHSAHSKPHVQSMILATDRTGLRSFLPVIKACPTRYSFAVDDEIDVSTAVRAAGYDLFAFMTAFASRRDYATTCTHGNVLYENTYYGGNLHPYETIFQKANKGAGIDTLQHLTEWTDAAGYSSWVACGRDPAAMTGRGAWGRWGQR